LSDEKDSIAVDFVPGKCQFVGTNRLDIPEKFDRGLTILHLPGQVHSYLEVSIYEKVAKRYQR
jgi:hypothetical protein